MNSFSDDEETSPEPKLSELCISLENKFANMQDNKGDSMSVYARIRPMLVSETEAGYKECIGLIDDQVVRAVAPASSSKFKMNSHLYNDIIEDFTFTAAYGPETGQFVFFQECMMDTMKNFIEGQNSLVFSYGTTGSGKTYTLQGNVDNPGIIPLTLHLFFASIEDQLLDKVFFKPDKFSDVVALNDNEIKKELEIKDQLLSSCNQEEWSFRNSSSKSLGMLLCETFSDHFEGEARQTTLGPEEMAQAQAAALMKEISKNSADKQSGYCSVWVSFVEIYNENIYDLLQPNVNQRAKLNLGEDKNGDVYVKGLREVWVSNSQEALSLLTLGQRNLRIASTKLNYQSSRSHCIFTVKVIRLPDPENMSLAKVNKLSFCDLAGSERAAKSQTTGMRLKEAGCINTSLLVLGRCLEQLRLSPSQRDKKLIPFRESKLTRLFSGFFTGRGKAVMITNASPCELTFDETLHVLRFSAVAKELIINDSYITTAANTLQSITNMYTDVKANCKNQSLSSNKSISFDDTIDEVLQEKDELIEKLLDLAESLKNNLEREKKEKAELEIKIRQDVCFEYAEFRDELLSMQKQSLEEEKDAIREIYEKRIAAMEKRYEKIITDFQIEESFSSDDENFKDASTSFTSVNEAKQCEMKTNASENKTPENTSALSEACVVSPTASFSRKTSEELQKTVDYSLSLEVELERLRSKYEDAQTMLEKTVKENDDIKKELDAYKIDVLALKTDNETLLKEKLDLEADLKAFRDDLVTVTQEKEQLIQDLTDAQDKLSCLNTEIDNLLKSINDLTREKEESVLKFEKSSEEYSIQNKQLEDQLLAVSEKLESAKNEKEHFKSLTLTMEKKICELEAKIQDNIMLKDVFETLSQENDDLKNRNNSLKKELELAEASIAVSKLSGNEIEKMRAAHHEEIKILNDSLKKHQADAEEAEAVLKSINKVLGNSQDIIEKQKNDINLLEEECMSLKKEILELQVEKKDAKEKLESLATSLENEQKLKEQYESESKKLEDALSTIDLQKGEIEELKCENRTYLNELSELKEMAKELEERLAKVSSQNESDVKLKEQYESESKRLEVAVNTIDVQKGEIEKLKCENKKYLNDLAELQETKKELEEKLDNMSFQNESLEKLRNQLESESKKFEEAVCTISSQKDEITTLKSENMKFLDKLSSLEKEKKALEDTLNSTASQNGLEDAINEFQSKLNENVETIQNQLNRLESLENIYEKTIAKHEISNKELKSKLKSQMSLLDNVIHLTQVLENCELQAAHKIQELQSNLKKLKENLAASSIDHEKECSMLHELIEILEKCEDIASKRIKQFHSTNIKHVEQIMDLKSSLKTKEKIIDTLNNDINDLQKKYKELQTSSKKQLSEMQKLKSDREEMEERFENFKKFNESVKCELARLQVEKEKLETDYKKLKEDVTKGKNEEKHIKNKTPERTTSRKLQEEATSDNNSGISVLKEIKNQNDKKRNKKITEQSDKIIENSQEKAITKSQVEKRSSRKSEQSESSSENKKQKKEAQENKRRNRKTVEVSENSIERNKKQKTEIYEEVEENSSNETLIQVKKSGRRHLKCMSNVTDERAVLKQKDENSSKSRTSKRKVDLNEYKSPEKKNLKKIKMPSNDEVENAHKPQNLRVMLLKNSVNVNDIPLPSPRMTRGRKRLVLAKELTVSPRTVRS